MSCAHPRFGPCLAGLQENVFNSLTPTCHNCLSEILMLCWTNSFQPDLFTYFFIGRSFFRNAICWSTGEICSIFSLYLLKSLLAKPGPIHLLLFLSSHLSSGVKAEGGSFCDPLPSESHHAHGNLCSKTTLHLHAEGHEAALCIPALEEMP